jgi:Domain of unknown function (DUF4276)
VLDDVGVRARKELIQQAVAQTCGGESGLLVVFSSTCLTLARFSRGRLVETAPSKRLARVFPRYQKALHGPLAIDAIGVERIRTACPHFASWLARLEAVAAGRSPAIGRDAGQRLISTSRNASS